MRNLLDSAWLYLIPSASRRVAALMQRNRNQRAVVRAAHREVARCRAARRSLGAINLAYQEIGNRTIRERDAARAERDLLRDVAVKARVWRDAVAMASAVGVDHTIEDANRASRALIAAVDALPKMSGTVPAELLGRQ